MTEIGREHNRLCAVIAVLALRDLRSGAADVRILPLCNHARARAVGRPDRVTEYP